VAFTLVVALLSNLNYIAIYILLTMEKLITDKSFSEPLLPIYDDEDGGDGIEDEGVNCRNKR
jgi:uncharacterized protein